MLKIVTANYLSRGSATPWLMRDKNTDPKSAVAFAAIVAEKVSFGESDAYERGFGCTIVAESEIAVGHNDAIDLDALAAKHAGLRRVKLVFCGYWFEDGNGNRVDACEHLVLNTDGSMVGFLKQEQPAAAEKAMA